MLFVGAVFHNFDLGLSLYLGLRSESRDGGAHNGVLGLSLEHWELHLLNGLGVLIISGLWFESGFYNVISGKETFVEPINSEPCI